MVATAPDKHCIGDCPVDTIIIGNMQRQLRKQEQEIKRMLAANEEKKMAQIPLIPLE